MLQQETLETFVDLYTRTISDQAERLRQFTRMATHEWRQPLAPIMTAVAAAFGAVWGSFFNVCIARIPAGLSIVDVENLRLHYARTLAHLNERFRAGADRVRAAYGEEFYRAWDLYLAGSEAAFRTGWMQLFQVVFVPRESPPPSWTRADVYESRSKS